MSRSYNMKRKELKEFIKASVREALQEFRVSKAFKKATEEYHALLFKRQESEKEQKELVGKFKASSPEEKEKLKPELISLHKYIKSLEPKIAKAERAYNKAIAGEPIELE